MGFSSNSNGRTPTSARPHIMYLPECFRVYFFGGICAQGSGWGRDPAIDDLNNLTLE